MELDDGLEEAANEGGERLPRRPVGEGGEEDLTLPIELPLGQRHHDRVLVREVLVERADRDARALRDAIRRPRRVSALLENPSCAVEDRRDRFSRPALLGPLAGFHARALGHGPTPPESE
jgi:hypothetical protein